jgi:CHAT domain-containing protein
MGRRSIRSHGVVLLLTLALAGASAAETPLESARTAARVAIDRAEYDAAQKIIDDGLTRFAPNVRSEALWALRVMKGEVLIMRGDALEAQSALKFDLPSPFRHSETAVRQLIMRATVVHRLQQEGRGALLEEARKLATAFQPAALADVYNALAAADSKRREEYSREAIALARKHGRRVTEAKAMTNFALSLVEQQRYAEGIQLAERALALGQSLRLPPVIQGNQGNLGSAYFDLGDYEMAEELTVSAEGIAARIHLERPHVVWLNNLGKLRYQRRDWEGADRYFRQTAALGTRFYPEYAAYALANLAYVAMERGNFTDARKFNAQAMELKRTLKDEEAELNSDVINARIATRESDYARAQKLLENAVRETKRSTTRMDAEIALGQLFARMRKADLATTHFKSAVEIATDTRGEIKDRDLLFSFFNSVSELFGSYIDFLASRKSVTEALAVTELSRAQTLSEGLKSRALGDARTIAKQNNATILCYWLGRDRSYLWVVTPNDVVMKDLPPDTTIEKAVETYRARLLGPSGSMQGSGAQGEELYRMLVEPAGIAKGARVIVVAEGKLNTLNFETLVVPAPKRHYWIEDVTVMNAGSLQLLARAATKPASASRMLVVGNAQSPDPSFPPLKYAAVEIRAVAKRFVKPVVLEGAAATPAAYKAATPGAFDYVHFVAHGVASRKRPLDSAVILAPDATKSYKLLARDVVEQPLTARLVTISSCHGAGSRTYAGEGVVGLAWAFLRAGADQVIAALWEVNDTATPQLMDDMYAGIRANRDPAVALRAAKLKLVRSEGVFRYPKYWAPFVIYAGT